MFCFTVRQNKCRWSCGCYKGDYSFRYAILIFCNSSLCPHEPLNAHRLINSYLLSRGNYPHFIAYLRFTNLRRYIVICEVETKVSQDFAGWIEITEFVIHSTYSSQEEKNCICCVWGNSNLSSAKFVLLPHPPLKTKKKKRRGLFRQKIL